MRKLVTRNANETEKVEIQWFFFSLCSVLYRFLHPSLSSSKITVLHLGCTANDDDDGDNDSILLEVNKGEINLKRCFFFFFNIFLKKFLIETIVQCLFVYFCFVSQNFPILLVSLILTIMKY